MAKYLDEAGLSHLKERWNIDGVRSTQNGLKRIASCTTSASTAAKTATITAGTIPSNILTTGTTVAVTFAHSNTASNPTLNINNTGAYNILVGGTAIDTPSLLSGTVLFIFDGTAWNLIGASGLSAADRAKLDGIEAGAEVNQNAFSNIKVGSTTVAADSKTDTVTFVGSGVTITPDATNDTITFTVPAGVNTTYTFAEGTTNGAFNVTPSDTQVTQSVPVHGVLTSHQTIKQDGVTGATVNRFATCSTAAGTGAKTASITTGTFSLEAGAIVAVKFANANTATSGITLAINNTTAKNIFVNGTQITSEATGSGLLKGTVVFIYDGTQYNLIGNYRDTNTTYTAGTGISLGGTGSTVINHTNSVTAKSSQGVYPITFDAQGHIAGSGDAIGTMTYDEATAGTNRDGKFISAKVLNDTILNAIGGVTGFRFEIVNSYEDLPVPGSYGVIYLVPKTLTGTCDTAAATAAKTATVSGTISLEVGTAVTITFTNTNTANNPTLNINSTGAKSITVNGVPITTGSDVGLLSGTVSFVYNGTTWALVDEIDNAYIEYIWITTGSGSQTIVEGTPVEMDWSDLPSGLVYYDGANAELEDIFEISNNTIVTTSGADEYECDPQPTGSTVSSGNTFWAYDETLTNAWHIEVTGASYQGDAPIERSKLSIQDDPSTGKYEGIGTTDINLSMYWSKAELTSLTDTEIDTILNS